MPPPALPILSHHPFPSPSRRVRQRKDDDESTAGARNAASVVARMPATLSAMAEVRRSLLMTIKAFPALQNLHRACGPEAARQPPSQGAVALARRRVCRALGIAAEEGELHHPASPLRYGLFQALVDATGDCDRAPPVWLRSGAPLGIQASIPPGGHFPRASGPPPSPVELLEQAPLLRKNHPSFNAVFRRW